MGPYFGSRLRCRGCGYEEPIRDKWDAWSWVDVEHCASCEPPKAAQERGGYQPTESASRVPPTAPDPNARIVARVLQRAAEGERKYGVGMTRHDLAPGRWLQEAIDEALDLAVYLEKLKEYLGDVNDRNGPKRSPRG